MSETELNKGTLTKLDLTGTLEEKCRQAVIDLNLDYNPKYHDSFLECVEDSGYRKAHIHNCDIYRVEYDQFEDNEDIFDAEMMSNGEISFTTKYYNGGCSFNEALGKALEKLVIIK